MENLFLVCLIPPPSIVEDIDEIRNQISAEFKVYESLKRPAHITLYNPVKISSQAKEDQFFKTLENAVYLDSFHQVLMNFNSFPPSTFYLDVEQNESVMNLQQQIKEALRPLNLLPEKSNLKFTPHLTLAYKDVKPEVFTSIKQAFKDRKFKRNFKVSGFSVYKHIDRRWQPYKEFTFKNPQEKPKPLSLFD